MNSVFEITRDYARQILDFLFPPICLGCGRKDTALCESCLAGTLPAREETLKNVFSLYPYQKPIIKKAIWMLKYSNRRDIAKHFGIVLYEELLDEWSERKQFARFENPLLIPIPISKKKLKKRGYNQTALIVKEILNNDANNYFSADFSSLQKIKETPSQMSLRDRRKRLANLHDAFHVSNPEKIRGRNIILIDDITTTGATLAEARRALKYAGANKIICFAVAH